MVFHYLCDKRNMLHPRHCIMIHNIWHVYFKDAVDSAQDISAEKSDDKKHPNYQAETETGLGTSQARVHCACKG